MGKRHRARNSRGENFRPSQRGLPVTIAQGRAIAYALRSLQPGAVAGLHLEFFEPLVAACRTPDGRVGLGMAYMDGGGGAEMDWPNQRELELDVSDELDRRTVDRAIWARGIGG